MASIRDYALITAAYWGFTLTDGALRMLVLLHFHTLGYSPFEIAALFLLYELCGVGTNLVGGWIGVRFGLRPTLLWGLALQIGALAMLSAIDDGWPRLLSVGYVMASQALSGIAKDLTKMSAKSAIKIVAPQDGHSTLYRWVAMLTGSKNALKGVGFFMGAALLASVGFAGALWTMAGGLAVLLVGGIGLLPHGMGQAKAKTKFKSVLSKSRSINLLSAARFFLFGARDIWFAVALPVFLYQSLHWSFKGVGAFMALWVIGYGFVQSIAPRLTGKLPPHGGTAFILVGGLALVPALIALALGAVPPHFAEMVVVSGLAVFGAVFALNSSVHSYLILAYSDGDKIAMDVGYYYMANAMGRLVGTVLSGWLFQVFGLGGCLWGSALFLATAAVLSARLPKSYP